MRKLSAVIGTIALAMYASADVRNIRPPTTGEGKLGTTTYKWGEVNAVKGYFSDLILGGHSLTNKFLSPHDGAAGEVFYANGLGGGLWGAASSPSNGISKAVADVTYASIGQGERADSALLRDGSEPMTGDLDMDGYDIDDVGIISSDKVKYSDYISMLAYRLATSSPYAKTMRCSGSMDGTNVYAVFEDAGGYYSVSNIVYIASGNNVGVHMVVEVGESAATNSPVTGALPGDDYFKLERLGIGTVSATVENSINLQKGQIIAKSVLSSTYSDISVILTTHAMVGGAGSGTETERCRIAFRSLTTSSVYGITKDDMFSLGTVKLLNAQPFIFGGNGYIALFTNNKTYLARNPVFLAEVYKLTTNDIFTFQNTL